MVAVKNNKLTLKHIHDEHWEDVAQLIHSDASVHRHLGWCPPLDWLGKEPYLGLYRGGDLVGALACPPDEDSNTWLRLLAVAAGEELSAVWKHLWPPARANLGERKDVWAVHALAMQPWLEGLLQGSGFQRTYQVLVMEWKAERASYPSTTLDVEIREMQRGDLQRVYDIDRAAFDPLWRNSLKNLGHALDVAHLASVVVVEGEVAGYQISTADTLGGHLARLAVHPRHQGRGVGTALVAHMLRAFEQQGVVRVSVNTQVKNLGSIKLYEKFGFQEKDETYPVYQYFYER